MKRLTTLLLLPLLLLTGTAMAQTPQENDRRASTENRREEQPRRFNALNKINMVAAAVSRLYVDVIDEDTLAEKTIAAMLKQLDPHSTYLPPHEAKQTLETLSGRFDGIGVQINMLNDTLLVVQTIVGGPSEKAGILPGDRIVTVDDTLVAGVKRPINNIITMLRGKRGSKVSVGVVRRGVSEPITFKITRDKIPVNSIDATYMLDDSTGYIRLSRFAEKSAEEMEKAVKSLRKEGMRRLILDLQGNGGGYLNVAVAIADMFLDKDQLIVYTEGRNTRRAQEKASGKPLLPDERVVVMVDELSASASEILAGALQDWDRAVVVGRRTFGKGLVQRPITLPDQSLLRLTVARYHTPTGRCIQRPYVKGESEAYEQDLNDRFMHGELMNADSIPEGEGAYLGILGRTIDSQYSQALGIPSGAYVSQVVEGSPAETAGIEAGDVITGFEGSNVSTMDGLKEKISLKKAGDEVKITLQRMNQNGTYEEQEVTVTLGKESDYADAETATEESATTEDTQQYGTDPYDYYYNNGNGNNGNGGDYYESPFDYFFN